MNPSPADPFAELSRRLTAPDERVLAALHESMRKEASTEPEGGAQRLSRRKLRSRAQRAGLSVLLLGGGLLLVSLSTWSEQLQWLVLAAVASSLATGGLLLAGAVPGHMSRWSQGPRRVLLTVLALGLLAVLSSQADHFLSLVEILTDASASAHLAGCFGHALMTGTLFSGLLMAVWRRTDPFSPELTGALLGLLGGAFGTLSVALACSNSEGFHLTLGHGSAALLLAGIGFFAGRRWLTP